MQITSTDIHLEFSQDAQQNTTFFFLIIYNTFIHDHTDLNQT